MLYSRFQSPGFRIPQAKISRIPEFPTWGEIGDWIGHEEMAESGGGGGSDGAMYTAVNGGGKLSQKCDFDIEMFYFIINRNRNVCFKK